MKNREWLRRLPVDLLIDIVGGLIYAVGLNCFCSPNDIAPGGMSGVAVIVNYLFDFPLGIVIFCINIPLLVLAWLYLGHDFTLHSLKTILVWSLLVDLVAPYLPAYAGDKILAALFGGVSIGISVAMVFLRGSTTGGTDILGRVLLRRFQHIPLGKILLAMDFVIVTTAGFFYGTLEASLYAIVSIYAVEKATDSVLYGFNESRIAYIVSDKPT